MATNLGVLKCPQFQFNDEEMGEDWEALLLIYKKVTYVSLNIHNTIRVYRPSLAAGFHGEVWTMSYPLLKYG